MVVVEDKDNLIGDSDNLVDQSSQDGLDRRRLGGLKRAQNALSKARFNDPLKRGDQIAQKAGRVIVALVQRKPGAGPGILVQPLGQQGGRRPDRWGSSLLPLGCTLGAG